jgi:hypothetical protein
MQVVNSDNETKCEDYSNSLNYSKDSYGGSKKNVGHDNNLLLYSRRIGFADSRADLGLIKMELLNCFVA